MKSRWSFALQKYPSCGEPSQAALVESAQRQLRGGRAAIGSEGKMGNKGLFPVGAVPLAFFGTFFRVERKYCPPRDGSPTVRAGVGASVPPARDSLTAKLPCVAISRGLFARPLHSFGSPTETPKHPVPRRSRRVMLHPWASGMRLRAHKRAFRSPFGNLRAPKVARNP